MTGTVPLDRRQRRRQETIEQVLDVAVEVMADHGVAGLTLGEVARRMGIRPPSLYVYFDGKHALYDALFERGWRTLLENIRAVEATRDGTDLVADLVAVESAFVRWAVEHPAYAPLMFWRPVPGFAPSAEAYAPAVEIAVSSRAFLARLQAAGMLAPGADLDLVYRTQTAVISGVITQQLANAPGEPFETGTFTSTLPDVVAMWLAHHGGPPIPPSD
ncbi:TetR/AcrR family transcriptional regulator [Blastococcus sp. CT_GayMR20]|uniref:TetR/AcrR family transcriptional regulator n=1 Tax=Blastococcus sp. CT_GayMR20 TaxID=2559609 RepID=UPI0010733A88|nr:TetR/AcrR family transcriptional regulator [Blastococcus sp. CT_GayMR20]TFV65279.1 TetR/AcrR family transcriptional regulator [Blastococcus sp. CT_GayMR20]